MSEPREFDAVIVGAGYGGLICGAILAGEGLRILIVDRTPGIGGVCTSLPIPGLPGVLAPYGHASARDTADLFLIMSRRHRFGLEAASRAKVARAARSMLAFGARRS